MEDWYVDKGLGTLIRQVKAKHPGMSVGTIAGAQHHRDNPDSPHEPEADGSVDAGDFMIGPHFTVADADALVAALLRHRDHRLLLIIWKRRKVSSVIEPWTWRKYGGDDPHTGHIHVEVNDLHESDLRAWNLTPAPKRPGYTGTPVRSGDKSGRVRQVQAALADRGMKLAADGEFGPATLRAVKAFQAAHKLVADGIVGPRTWKELFK